MRSHRHVKLVTFLPTSLRLKYRSLRRWLAVRSSVGVERLCPVCDRSSSRFSKFGRVPRPDAQCIHCGALERHRLLWVFLRQRPELMRGGEVRLLHVAPEACLAGKLQAMAGPGYLSADLMRPDVMECMDICSIRHPDASFDAIYCSHVLEHVADDRKAMHEFHRILRGDGWAILMVPKGGGATFEDPSITSREARLEAFGQEDHVRLYGDDFVDRLRDSGFHVEVFDKTDLMQGEEIVRMGLAHIRDEIFFCTKPGAP